MYFLQPTLYSCCQPAWRLFEVYIVSRVADIQIRNAVIVNNKAARSFRQIGDCQTMTRIDLVT